MAPGAATAGTSLVNEADGDTVVLRSPLEPVGDVLMTPEIIDHRTTLCAPALGTVTDAVEVACHDFVHPILVAELDKVADVVVDRLPKPPFPQAVQPRELGRGVRTIDRGEEVLTRGDFISPVPPVAQ